MSGIILRWAAPATKWLATRQDLALVAMIVATLLMLVMPIPVMLADMLIVTNIGLALLLIMVAVYMGSPVEFSTLPTIVLLTTAFRLSLSIATSRALADPERQASMSPPIVTPLWPPAPDAAAA